MLSCTQLQRGLGQTHPSRPVRTRPQLLGEDTDTGLDLLHRIKNEVFPEAPSNDLDSGRAVFHQSGGDDAAEIHPGATVRRSVIGPGAVVAEGSRVCDSVVMAGSRIGEGAVVDGSLVGRNATIGPDAQVLGLVSGARSAT